MSFEIIEHTGIIDATKYDATKIVRKYEIIQDYYDFPDFAMMKNSMFLYNSEGEWVLQLVSTNQTKNKKIDGLKSCQINGDINTFTRIIHCRLGNSYDLSNLMMYHRDNITRLVWDNYYLDYYHWKDNVTYFAPTNSSPESRKNRYTEHLWGIYIPIIQYIYLNLPEYIEYLNADKNKKWSKCLKKLLPSTKQMTLKWGPMNII